MKIMYLDESGDHSLTKVDPSYPVFVLGGVIVDQDYANGVIQPELNQLKRDFFGNEQLILHTADISRNRNGFERVKDSVFRAQFYERLNEVMQRWDYQVVACAIRKDHHLSRYGDDALDPYMLSLNVLVERFCMEIGNQPSGGLIMVEARGHPLDAQLQLAWARLQVTGTQFMRAAQIKRRIAGLNIHPKSENIAGLQLADLVVSPIGRHVLGKKRHRDFEIVESKFRRHLGRYEGAGLVVLPKQ